MSNDAYIDSGDCYEDALLDNAHNGQEHPDQQEANFYFAIHEFQDIIKQYGVKKVIAELPQDVYDLLYWYFYDKAMADPFEISDEIQYVKVPWTNDNEEPPF